MAIYHFLRQYASGHHDPVMIIRLMALMIEAKAMSRQEGIHLGGKIYWLERKHNSFEIKTA